MFDALCDVGFSAAYRLGKDFSVDDVYAYCLHIWLVWGYYFLVELLLESALHYGRHSGQNRSYRRVFLSADCAK